MASGNNSSHSKAARPLKSNSVTNAAVPSPNTATPTATMRHSVIDVQA